METLDLGWMNGGIGKALSNLYPYPFILDEIQCASFEGFLQSLKFPDYDKAIHIRTLHGYKAYKQGQDGNEWKEKQFLYWNGVEYPRASRSFKLLIERAYDACLEQNEEFRQAFLDSGFVLFTHYRGHHDQTETTLTETEYLYNMYRLRTKVYQELK